MRWLRRLLVFLSIVAFVLVAVIWIRHGGGDLFPNRTTDPEMTWDQVEVVANLELPPGNIAVSRSDRVFFSFHPEANPEVQLAELIDGNAIPYPTENAPTLESILSLRIDRQNRLWVLDNANHGTGKPQILAFNLINDRMIHQHDFDKVIAPLGSHLNDFQVDPAGRKIYIADASIMAKNPAIIVYDTQTKISRRLLENHESVSPEHYVPVVQDKKMQIFGVFAIRPGVDSIALDRTGEWLYFAAVTARHLYRVRTRDINDESLSPGELAKRVEPYGRKTMSDGISTDNQGNVYLTDLEHSAIVLMGADRKMRTLLKDRRLRWPDGLSFGPGGWLYITCSSLHTVIMESRETVQSHAPYQIFRFRPPAGAVPGH